MSASPVSRPPITCHVLNTVTGRPADSMPVTLTMIRPYGPSSPLTATTNEDGRVTAWNTPASGPDLDEIFTLANTQWKTSETDEHEMVWALKFDAGAYFQREGFWQEIEVRFKTVIGGRESRQHWHIPLLLSPWSYTTYRGS